MDYRKLLITLVLFLLPAISFAQVFTTNQGGTGLRDVAAGSIPFGSLFNIRMATSSALQFNNSLSRLTVTYASSTAISATNINATSFFGAFIGNLTGTASLATSLAANGANCSAGSYPLGVDASGAAEGCTADAIVTAGDALTLTGTDIDFDGGATPNGDLGGTWAAITVDDDGHAHTGATLSGIDISDDTNLTAGDALTITGDDIDFDGGATPAGDLGGTWASPSVTDDSHAHTATTISGLGTADISGLDISDDTNLAAGLGLALTGDSMGLLATGAADGECLTYVSTGPTIDWVTCASGGGGGSGGTWSTTTSQVSGQLINYPNNNDDIVTIGDNSTTTAEFWFDPNTMQAIFGTGAAGDSTLAFGPSAFDQWLVGFDDTDNSFAIASSTALGTTNALTIDRTNLRVTMGYASTTALSATNINATTFFGALSGNASTATALAANGANCSAGSAPLGVDASGAVETCFDVWTEAENTAANYEQSLTAGDCLTRTGDDFDVDDCFLLNTGDTGTGLYTLTYASTTAFSSPYASSTALFAGALTISPSGTISIGGDTIDELAGDGLEVSSGDLIFDCSDVASTGITCSGEDLTASLGTSIAAAEFADGDWGELTVSSGVVTIDDDVLGAEHFADQDWGDITIAAGVASVEDNSHAHDATTISGLGTADISGLDVSDDLNLTAGDNLTLTGDDIDLDSALTALTGIVSTGLIDFGAAVLEIANGVAPTADDVGEIAHDTSDNQLILDDFVVGRATERIWGATIASTSPYMVGGTNLAVPDQADGYTMTSITCRVVSGTSVAIIITDGSNATESITCDVDGAADDGTITNAAVTAGEDMYLDFGTVTGSVDTLSVSVFGTWTRE